MSNFPKGSFKQVFTVPSKNVEKNNVVNKMNLLYWNSLYYEIMSFLLYLFIVVFVLKCALPHEIMIV